MTGFTERETAPARPPQGVPPRPPHPLFAPCRSTNLSNVRKTPPAPAEDAELKASIKAVGLKQNLVVHPASPARNGAFAVVAGGRRLRVLQDLAAEGFFAADFKVPCLVEQTDQAVETSLMENTARAAMHPADEFAAIAALIDAGASPDAVALRFGVSERHVRQRLRLGRLAPELLDAFRAGAINLDVATAFTLGADHAAQLAVWRQVKGRSYIQPYSVRHLLTETAMPLDSELGLFVGGDAYKAAGGHITHDLFSDDDEGFLDDPALVRQLAIVKLEVKAAELRPHWAWTKAVLDPEYGFLAKYARLRPQPGPIPAELSAEIERIEHRLGELDGVDEDAWTDELAAEAAQHEERRIEIDAIIEGLAVYSDEDRARAGCIVTVGDGGGFCLHLELVERAAMLDSGEALEAADYDSPDEAFEPSSADDDEDEDGFQPSRSGEQTLRKECGFSQSLIDDLKAHRLQITRAHLAADFPVAFDLALYTLCVDLFDRRHRSLPLDLRAVEASPRSTLNDLSGTPADRLIETHGCALDLDWLELQPGQRFEALSALSAGAKQRLFAWCIASCLKPQLAFENLADPAIECAGRRLAIPFADHWRPTAANYWSRVKKAHGLGIGAAVLGLRWERDHADDKKSRARGGARGRVRSRQKHRRDRV